MKDTHYGFRNAFTHEPEGEPEMTDWDFSLISAVQFIEDYTDQNGLLVWEKESPRVDVMAVPVVDRFENAKSRASERASKRTGGETPGTSYVPRLKLMGGDWGPMMDEWFEAQAED